MENEGMKYFVWTQGLCGPIPQVWDEKVKTQEGKPIKSTAPIRLLDNDERSLEQFAQEFTYELCLTLDKGKDGVAIIK